MVFIRQPAPTWGQIFGRSAGRGIAGALEELAEKQANEMLQRKQAAAFKAAGLPEEYAGLPQNIQGPLAVQALKQQQSEREFEQYRRSKMPAKADLPLQQQGALSQFAQAAQQAPLQAQQMPQQMPQQPQLFPLPQQVQQQIPQQMPQPVMPAAPQQLSPLERIDQALAQKRQQLAAAEEDAKYWTAKHPQTLGKAEQLGLDTQRAEIKNLERQRDLYAQQEFKQQEAEKGRKLKRELQKEKIATSKEAKNYELGVKADEEIDKEVNRAKRVEGVLGQLRELNESDELPTRFNSVLYDFGNKFGLNITGLIGAKGEQFNATVTELVDQAKNFFPGRVTDADLKVFFKMLPGLANSKDGRELIIDKLQNINDAVLAKDVARTEVLTEHKEEGGKGEYPDRYNAKVQKRGRELQLEAAKEFKRNLTELKRVAERQQIKPGARFEKLEDINIEALGDEYEVVDLSTGRVVR